MGLYMLKNEIRELERNKEENKLIKKGKRTVSYTFS
jgi:hypothetical protein